MRERCHDGHVAITPTCHPDGQDCWCVVLAVDATAADDDDGDDDDDDDDDDYDGGGGVGDRDDDVKDDNDDDDDHNDDVGDDRHLAAFIVQVGMPGKFSRMFHFMTYSPDAN
ncbi:hypothetical protein SprV_0401444800 [Sparganum proliferum]